MNRDKSHVLSRARGKSYNGTGSHQNIVNKSDLSRSTKANNSGKKKHFQQKINIQQAVDEALDDCSEDVLVEYQSRESELTPSSSVINFSLADHLEAAVINEVKRRHSYDLQVTKSPLLEVMDATQVEKSFSLDSEVVMISEKTVEDYTAAAERLHQAIFRLKTGKIPTKVAFSVKQEHELRKLLLNVVQANGSIADDDDDVLYYITSKVIATIMSELRYEVPYGQSVRWSILEALCRRDLLFDGMVSHLLVEYLLQYVEDERRLQADDDDFSAVQKEVGCIHRYVMLLQTLVDMLRCDMSLHPPATTQQQQAYFSRAAVLLRAIQTLMLARSAVEKYAEILSSSTLTLFSAAPSLIQPFYIYILKHWPRGFSQKVGSFICDYYQIISLIGFLENLMAASPPLYLTPFLRPIITRVFKKLCAEMLGCQVEVSKRVAYFMQNFYIRNNYVSLDEGIGDVVKLSLTKGMNHWNEVVSVSCEKAFDVILDDS